MKVMLKSLVLSSILLIPFNIALAEDKEVVSSALLEQVLTELHQLKEEIKTMKKPIPSVKEKIRAGKKFAVVLYSGCYDKIACSRDNTGYGTDNNGDKNNANDPLGTFLFGHQYHVKYHKNAEGKHVWEVSGIQEDGMNFISPSHAYDEDHIERNEMVLWGGVFNFDESASVFYKEFGLVGRIVFLEE